MQLLEISVLLHIMSGILKRYLTFRLQQENVQRWLEQPCPSTYGFSLHAAHLVAPAVCGAVTWIVGELSYSLMQEDGEMVGNNESKE